MLDLKTLYDATDPTKPLGQQNHQYYVDFTTVRGTGIIETLGNNIALSSSEGQKSIHLFTGHIGCGKSTELLQLKTYLEQQGFHVVYISAEEDLDLNDVAVSDIMLMVAHQVGRSLEQAGIFLNQQSLVQALHNFFTNDATLCQRYPELGRQILTALAPAPIRVVVPVICSIFQDLLKSAQGDVALRNKIRGYLEPLTTQTIKNINQQLLDPAVKQLQQLGKRGIVVIIDGLDKLGFTSRPGGSSLPAFLFVQNKEQLGSLNCHIVYTIPLALLRFSENFATIPALYGQNPLVLPMVPVQYSGGEVHDAGIAQLRQMVLARAFPDLDSEARLEQIPDLFENQAALDYLCQMSGGHIRNLLRYLRMWLQKERRFPLSRYILEALLQEECISIVPNITDIEWNLLRKVAQDKEVRPVDDSQKPCYQQLLRNLLVLEYRDSTGQWFDINPILKTAKRLRSKLEEVGA